MALFGRYQYLSHAAREHAAAAEASGHPVVGFGEQVEAVGRLMREGKVGRGWTRGQAVRHSMRSAVWCYSPCPQA